MASNYYQQHLGTSSSYPLELTGPVNITNLTYVYPPIISTNSNFTSGTNTSTSFTFTIANQNYGNGTYLYSCQNQWSSTANLPWLVNGVFNAGQPGVLFTDFTTQAGSYNSSSPFNYIGGTTITATTQSLIDGDCQQFLDVNTTEVQYKPILYKFNGSAPVNQSTFLGSTVTPSAGEILLYYISDLYNYLNTTTTTY